MPPRSGALDSGPEFGLFAFMLDYYRILDISPDTPQSALKSAYIKRLKQYHPDIYQGADATEKTQKINEAYQTLKDPQKRAAYDRARQAGGSSGRAWSGSPYGGGPYGGGEANSGGGLNDSQVLAMAAGGFAARRQELQNQMEQIIAGLLADINRRQSQNSAAAPIMEALERDFRARKARLLAENSHYYERFIHPFLQPSTLHLVAQLQASQQQFISRSMDSAYEQLLAAARGNAGPGSSGRAVGAPGYYAAFWWGFGLSLLLSWLPLFCIGLMLLFGQRKPARYRFLLGAVLGMALHWLLFGR